MPPTDLPETTVAVPLRILCGLIEVAQTLPLLTSFMETQGFEVDHIVVVDGVIHAKTDPLSLVPNLVAEARAIVEALGISVTSAVVSPAGDETATGPTGPASGPSSGPTTTLIPTPPPLARQLCPQCGWPGGAIGTVQTPAGARVRVYSCENAHKWTPDFAPDDASGAPPPFQGPART